MKKIFYYASLLILVLLPSQTYADSPYYNLSNTKSYTYNQSYVVKNIGDTPIQDVTIEAFIGNPKNFTYQKFVDAVYMPKPHSFKDDKHGNKIAVYKIKELSAYNDFKIDITYKLTNSDIKYNDDIQTQMARYNSAEYDKYLVEEEKIESYNQSIIDKAEELTYGYNDDYSKAKAIFKYVNSYITYDESTKYRNKGALSALKTGRGVCEEYATLFTALCRAADIPARVVTGFRFNDEAISINKNQETDITHYGHAWAEFYLDGYGWIPVEATQLVTINGVKQIYWEGFGGLESSKYIAIGHYNPSTQSISMNYYYYRGKTPKLDTAPLKSTIVLTDIQNNEKKDNVLITQKKEMNFSDIPSNYWAYDYILTGYQNGIINGYEDGTFKPNNNVSRIEFLVMLSRMLRYLDYDDSKDNAFTFYDYNLNHWSKSDYEYLANCFEKNEPSIGLAGESTFIRVFNNSLEPNKPITREEAVALFDRFIINNSTQNKMFSDIQNSEFESSIIKAYNAKLINGYSPTEFKPENNITRAEASKLFDTFIQIYGDE